MNIQYLGTAAAEGWPAPFCACPVCSYARAARGRNLRTRTQALIGGDLLIDFPPDTYCHALLHGLNLARVRTLLVTHSHMDHWFPAELIHRHEHFGHGAEGTLEVYGNEAVKAAFDANILIDRFKRHPLDGAVRFHIIHGGDRFSAGGWDITAIPADHDPREECLIYLCRRDGKALLYGHDTGLSLSQKAWDLLASQSLDLVSLDATLGRHSSPAYHMGLPDVEAMLEKLTALGCVDGGTVKVVNHFSHNGGMSCEELAAWGAERGILASYDGMEAEF